ncbi:UDP-GlcNAc:betaGal beta-1,3-N-acetylglucosaminyltransferase-like protein 1 [Ylistrum balloti]|uniref:UDP-GlcNAc:betaGal beta-1,3-N-acetylglucosaminyltransferase-like protein 1 n=1 Tax=Ylistrum balloti TaxID=509963 RepID=UPI002905DB6B|nr:UDP-GlcNAc:betaGal beta-1,3-N-acetylglucosaminyltransferase-like protein 1 [Ylistrum balloti]
MRSLCLRLAVPETCTRTTRLVALMCNMCSRKMAIDVSVVMPVYNGDQWLAESLQSVCNQEFQGSLELSVYNDASTDKSMERVQEWADILKKKDVHVTISENTSDSPRGVGFAKNKAVQASSGRFLCFLDADDVMHKERVARQYQAALSHPKCIVGSKFHRLPEGSTERYTRWANTISQEQLYTQIYTSHGPTVLMPTWFCSRDVYNKVGGFDEGGKGVPEDLIFFYRHLELGGGLFRVDEDLVMYRYHPQATTFSVHTDTIWTHRMGAIQDQVINKWSSFTIWNAGKQGRKLYRSLSKENQKKVAMFCDVDEKKIKKGVYIFEESKEKPKPTVPIKHFSKATKPFLICVKMDMTEGKLEENIKSLNLKEGVDFFHFN